MISHEVSDTLRHLQQVNIGINKLVINNELNRKSETFSSIFSSVD